MGGLALACNLPREGRRHALVATPWTLHPSFVGVSTPHQPYQPCPTLPYCNAYHRRNYFRQACPGGAGCYWCSSPPGGGLLRCHGGRHGPGLRQPGYTGACATLKKGQACVNGRSVRFDLCSLQRASLGELQAAFHASAVFSFARLPTPCPACCKQPLFVCYSMCNSDDLASGDVLLKSRRSDRVELAEGHAWAGARALISSAGRILRPPQANFAQLLH